MSIQLKTKSPFSLITLTTIFLLVGSIACFTRLYPMRNFVSNRAWGMASALVMNNATSQIRHSIDKTIQDKLAPSQKKQILTKQLNKAIRQDPQSVRQAIFQIAKEIDQKNPPPQPFPYLLGSDSYYYYDLTRILQETGHMSTDIKGSKYFHAKMAAPDGYWEPLNLHAYVGLALHKVIALFYPDENLLFSVSFTPLLLMLLSLICFLTICRNMNMSPWATLIASCYFISIPIVLKRTTFGWYDNDPYNVLFPMALMMVLSFSFQPTRKRGHTILGAILAVLLILYSLFWQGWVFIAAILTTSLIVASLYERFRSPASSKRYTPLVLLSFLGVSIIGISIILGFDEIFILFREGWDALTKFFNVSLSVWPDNYITVGELKRLPVSELAETAGGPVFLLFALIGLVSGALHTWKNSWPTFSKMWITCTIFGVAASIISFGAQRFSLLAATPLTLLFLFGIQQLMTVLKLIWKNFTPEKFHHLSFIGLLLIACLFSIPKISAAEKNMPALLNPVYNDTWDNALKYIKTHTPSNSIINSWWPPGHFIKAVADRRVIFDGATISNRQGYWLANALMASSETEALNYFRLLNNSGNQAVDLLLKAGMSDSRAISFLKHVIRLPKNQAREKIQAVLKSDPEELLAITHGANDPVYLLVYNEMVKNLLMYPFVSRWNFEKVEYLNAHPDVQGAIPSMNDAQQYIAFLWNLIGGKPKVSGSLPAISSQGSTIVFPENLVCDMEQYSCQIRSSQYGEGIPQFLVYSDGHHVIQKPLPNANLPYSIVVGNRRGHPTALLTDTAIARSLLVRLYFFGDVGLNRIHRIHQAANLTQQMQIDVFELDTNGDKK